jgi:hypothetical protein
MVEFEEELSGQSSVRPRSGGVWTCSRSRRYARNWEWARVGFTAS